MLKYVYIKRKKFYKYFFNIIWAVQGCDIKCNSMVFSLNTTKNKLKERTNPLTILF